MTAPRRDPHLGELVAAFADDALDPATRDRSLNHLAHCVRCRAEVDAQRRLRTVLGALPPPPCPPGLFRLLRDLPEVTPAPPDAVPGMPPIRIEAHFRTVRPQTAEDPVLVPAVLAAGFVPSTAGLRSRIVRPAGTWTGRRGPIRRPRRRLVVSAAGGVAAFALSLTGVVALGGDQPSPTRVRPPVASFISQHNTVTGGVPGSDPEVGVLDVADTGR